jgi:hypothetical protein
VTPTEKKILETVLVGVDVAPLADAAAKKIGGAFALCDRGSLDADAAERVFLRVKAENAATGRPEKVGR